MHIKRKIAQTLAASLCRHESMRRHLLTLLLKNYTTSLMHAMLQSCIDDFCRFVFIDNTAYKAPLLQRFAAILHKQILTDAEYASLTYAANADFHYSQEGEDLVLERLLAGQKNGFFVDVGAHHPTRFSNTYALYRKGWRGINIDATPGCMAAFPQRRPQDINIEAAVSDKIEAMPFHMFKEPALNTFDAALAEAYVQAGWELQGILDVIPRPLADILDEHLPSGMTIDLMSIDVEGGEMGVLKSNNWGKYAPRYLMLEVLDTPLVAIMDAPAIMFLRERGYLPISKLVQTVILQQQVTGNE